VLLILPDCPLVESTTAGAAGYPPTLEPFDVSPDLTSDVEEESFLLLFEFLYSLVPHDARTTSSKAYLRVFFMVLILVFVISISLPLITFNENFIPPNQT